MAFTNIPNGNLQVGAPLRSVDILALRDNIPAVMNGDTGAPRLKAAALDGGQSGSAPIFANRAWVNFNGTGTVSIRASGNVSSITDNGVGNYTVNFTIPMPDANYTASGETFRDPFDASASARIVQIQAINSATSMNIRTGSSDGAISATDQTQILVIVCR